MRDLVSKVTPSLIVEYELKITLDSSFKAPDKETFFRMAFLQGEINLT